ncbi:Ger(x)C family spore germination protein [Paenibacillus sp. FSL K6-0108]|uniref:Ger(x)C family spore germination protein n=1 Tax=Paenibacillus sp. FSL K6-0108 TaxID=2921417 RepID=UPI00324863B6
MRKSNLISAMLQLCKWLLPLVAVAALLPLTGCWDREEVNGLAIVTSAGFDRMKDGAIEMTLEIAAPQQKESSKTQSGDRKEQKGKTIIHSAVGETAGDAQGRLQMMLPRKIYWGQLQVLIVGEALARDGFREQLDYLVRHDEIRLRVAPFVTRGKARDFFELPYLLEQTRADFLQRESARVFQKPITISQLVQRFSSDQQSAILPFVDSSKEGGGSEGVPYIKGYAVFNQGKMVGTMTGNSYFGMRLTMNQLKRDVQTVNVGGESPSHVTLTTIRSNCRLLPSRKEGEWQMNIHISSGLSMIQNTTRLPMSEPKHIHKVEAAMAEHIRENVEQTVAELQRMRADIFGFGEAINRQNPREWSKLKPRWDNFFPRMKVNVAVDINVRRIGMNSAPAGLPPEEQRKP